MTSLIHVSHLRKVYGKGEAQTIALDDVSLQIGRGEFVAVMGPSGSGKSTLLQMLGFLDVQTSGSYIFDGISSHQYSERQLATIRNEKIGFVFQAFNLLPKTSVYDNVLLPLVYSHVPTAEWDNRVRTAIDAVGLTNRIHHSSGMLSGGEKQRCAIARALVMNPLLIFADEPTGNLDSASGQAIMDILAHLHQDGHTIMLITHAQETARYAKRVLMLHDGKLV